METRHRRRTASSGMSIIIAAWRVSEFLPACLESFYAQYNLAGIPLEIVLGVDACAASRDAFLSLPKPPVDVRAYWFPINRGPYVLYNSLVPLAKYPYLMFFGADDLALPTLVDAHCAVRLDYDLVLQEVVGLGTCASGAFGIWHSAFFKVGGFRDWRCSGDGEFRCRAKRLGLTCGRTDCSTFIYRRHEGQLTRRVETKMGSALRNEYRRSQAEEYSADGRIEPVIAECISL
jgi:glycosyltransferase involved in cell wall biosynthesis